MLSHWKQPKPCNYAFPTDTNNKTYVKRVMWKWPNTS